MRTVVGVMARAPVAGRCKTRLARTLGDERAARHYEAMLDDTLHVLGGVVADRLVILAAPEDDGVDALARLAPSPWEVVPQRGDDLGARLQNAFVDLGAGRAGLVCITSSDSPTLPAAPIAAQLALCHPPRRVLVGPCTDGGYYLIGMTSLELGVLAEIPWSTPGVMRATRARCATLALDLRELPECYDVDERADLDRLAAELRDDASRAPRTAEVLSRFRLGDDSESAGRPR